MARPVTTVIQSRRQTLRQHVPKQAGELLQLFDCARLTLNACQYCHQVASQRPQALCIFSMVDAPFHPVLPVTAATAVVKGCEHGGANFFNRDRLFCLSEPEWLQALRTGGKLWSKPEHVVHLGVIELRVSPDGVS